VVKQKWKFSGVRIMGSTKCFAVKLENLTKIIGKKKIIDDISFSINYGEVFGLLGVNGAGKTTIMRMLTGLIRPSYGCAYIGGVKVGPDCSEALFNVGAVIETPQLYKHLSGYMNLKIMANMYQNVSKDRIKYVGNIVGLSGKLNDKVRTYSLGMRQRLGIAIALLNNPNVLILDEPFNGLDPIGIMEIRGVLKELTREENVSVIISSHILSEMELICDRFAIIDKGRHIETKFMESTSSQEIMDVRFEMLNLTNPLKIEEVLNKIGVKANSISNTNFLMSCDRNTISKIINGLIKENIDIVSVIPKNKTLEEYFVGKVEEINNESAKEVLEINY
jgi:ABC-2 type transport system ATP-binding protein